jgi:hypothetical protein
VTAGIPVKIMSERLSHATTAFTQDVYMHSIPVLEEAAADRIGSLLFPEDPESKAVDGEKPALGVDIPTDDLDEDQA